MPAQYKKAPWANLGVDVEHGFKPLYIIDPDKKAHIQKLKAMAVNPGGGPGAEFRKRIEDDIARFTEVVKAANLKFEE